MVDPLYVLALFEDLNGKHWERFHSEKICELTYGRLQGKQALVDNFQHSVETRKVKPLILTCYAEAHSDLEALRNFYLDKYCSSADFETQEGSEGMRRVFV